MIHVRLTQRAIAQIGTLEIDARHRQHLARQIDTDGTLDLGPEDLEHAPRTGADIEEVAQPFRREQRLQRPLDLALGDVERADAVPLRRVGAEISRRLGGALMLDGGEALAIEGERGVGLRHQFDQEPRQLACPRPPGRAIEHPGALAEAVEQPGIAEQLQVPRHARLALPEDVGKLADREFALGAQHKQAKPGGLRRCAQPHQQLVHALHPLIITYIGISLYIAQASFSRG